jgi:hypothetical protein
MVTPPKYTVAEAREAMREVHDQYTIDFYALRRGEDRATASTYRADIAKNARLWHSQGFRVMDGPLETLSQAKFEIALDRARERADRHQLRRNF